MDLLLILIYAGLCTLIFKVFRIPLNKWTVPTAFLGGAILIGALLMVMNYNHPYARYAKEVFVSVPIVPAVKGIVLSVDAKPNTALKKGDLLFRIDPKPFEFAVRKKQAQLAEAEQLVDQNKAQYQAAAAKTKKTKADRDRAKVSYERYRDGAEKVGKGGLFSEQEVESRRQLYLASKATVESAQASEKRARLIFESEIEGINTAVARLLADLEAAEYDLERTQVRAPSDGIITQVALRPGVMAVPIPLRPSMVFIPSQSRDVAGSFWQNSLQRMQVGFDAEVIFDAIPGHVFKGKVKTILPAMSEGDVQASGNLISATRLAVYGRAIAIVELDEDLQDYNVPSGIQGKMAIISDHDPLHVSLIRRILLRMFGWLNYLFPIK